MKIENVITAKNQVEKVYELINNMASFYDLDMINLAYPNHDGVQDAEAASELMALRQSANSLATACNILVDKLTFVVGA